jgi:hypothetical protein
MDTAERTLVVILAAALAVLLILAIIATVKLIQILRTVKKLADKAEHIAEAAESFTGTLQKTLSSFAIGRMIRRLVRNMSNKEGPTKRKSKGGQ